MRFLSLGLLLMPLAVLAGNGPPPEYRDLFNGKDLNGWVIDGPAKDKQGNEIWSVQDGMILCTGKAFGFLRYDRQQFGDFALRVEYRFAPLQAKVKPGQRGNSGIGIRTPVYDPAKTDKTRPSWAAFEVQLLNDAGLKPTKESTGSLYRYLAPTVSAAKPGPEWNTIEIECVGPRVKVTLNGQQVVDADQRDLPDVTKDRPAVATAPKDKPLTGFICLQTHTGQIEFRKVQVHEIYTKPVAIEPKKGAKTGFVVGGKNDTALVKKLTELNNISIAELEKKMRPKTLSKIGFLGVEEKLVDVLAEDNALVVDKLGLTHQDLAWHLRVLAASGNTESLPYQGRKFKITVTSARNFIESPFADGTRTNTDVKVHNLDNGKKLQYSLLVPLMIERYGFYEGHDTPFRVDPLQVLEVLDFLRKKD
jgi:Domain of Unknown Function (DUF1080)